MRILPKGILPVFILSITVFACKDDQSSAAIPPQEITVVEVEKKEVPIYIEQVGQVYGLKDIPIRARVDGFLEKISFDEGAPVKKGQLLYSIDPSPFLADVAAYESRLSEAKTRLTNAKNELDRYKPLAKMNAVSKSDLDAAQASYDASLAGVDAAKANLRASNINLSYCEIRSPINGVIGKTEARVGEYIGRSPNPVILNTVSRIDTVRVQFSISENMYLRLAREYQKDTVSHSNGSHARVSLILGDNSVYEEEGTVDFINSQVDATTGSLVIQASFANPRKILRPGLYAKARILESVKQDGLLIPQRCVTEVQGQYSVYVVDANGVVEQRSIMLGQKIGDLWLVESGLQSGEKIVIDALQKVGPGLTVVPKVVKFESKTVNP